MSMKAKFYADSGLRYLRRFQVQTLEMYLKNEDELHVPHLQSAEFDVRVQSH